MRGLRLFETRCSRELRANATLAEQRMWAKLRNRQVGGYKFARQLSVGPYFLDFACRDEKLALEIDGATHSTDEEIAADARRSAFLAGNVFRILRFQNAEIFENTAGVLDTIPAVLEKRETL